MQFYEQLGVVRKVDDPSDSSSGWLRVNSDNFKPQVVSQQSSFTVSEVAEDDVNGKIVWDQIALDEKRADALNRKDAAIRTKQDQSFIAEINAVLGQCDTEQEALDDLRSSL